jgi:hypothetical protein
VEVKIFQHRTIIIHSYEVGMKGDSTKVAGAEFRDI